MTEEIKNHVQNLKDEGIKINIDDEQINDLVDKILRGTNIRDTSLGDTDIEELLQKYNDAPPLCTYHIDKSGKKHYISKDDIHDDFVDYVNKVITEDEFLQKFNVFINEFDAFSKAQGKKTKSSIGSNQKKLLKYGKKIKKIVKKKSSNP